MRASRPLIPVGFWGAGRLAAINSRSNLSIELQELTSFILPDAANQPFYLAPN